MSRERSLRGNDSGRATGDRETEIACSTKNIQINAQVFKLVRGIHVKITEVLYSYCTCKEFFSGKHMGDRLRYGVF